MLLARDASVPIPDGLSWWRSTPAGAAWLTRLPQLVADCARDWQLTVRAPFAPGSVSWVAPAELPDGTRAVLKVNFPDAESEHEAAALEWWGGEGAVRLLAHDAERRALLVERCEPGGSLSTVADEQAANRIAAGVLRRLLGRPAPPQAPFRSLRDEAARWAQELPARWARHGRPFPRRLLDEAVELCDQLGSSQPASVVCHQDLHGGNVLSTGAGWVAIDPKPLIGEPAFDLASLLRDRLPALLRSSEPGRTVRRRVELLADELALDRTRVRGWGIVHALAWGMSDTTLHADMVACAELIAAV